VAKVASVATEETICKQDIFTTEPLGLQDKKENQ
jgi:hypothetical protein